MADPTRVLEQRHAGDGACAVAFSGVRFTWPGRSRFTLGIEKFELARGERLLLLGPSGSGKSTFLSLLAGIVTPQAGDVRVLGTGLGKLGGAARDRFRAEHFGIIFQMFNLLPYGSLIDNVTLPLAFAPERRARVVAQGAPNEVARRLLIALGIDEDSIARAATAELSVGQQQRVAAARALIGAPQIIVADEPTSALDRDAQAAFVDLLFAEAARAQASVVMVSHDPTLASSFDRVERLTDIATMSRGAAA